MLAEGRRGGPQGREEGRRVRALALGRGTRSPLCTYILSQGVWWTWRYRGAVVPYGSCHDHSGEQGESRVVGLCVLGRLLQAQAWTGQGQTVLGAQSVDNSLCEDLP